MDPSTSVTLPDLCERADWQVVALASPSTPANWTLPGCHVLSIRDQRRLPFRVAQLLPWHSEARKSLGYAYAVAAGARVILDLEDGVIPSSMLPTRDDSYNAETIVLAVRCAG